MKHSNPFLDLVGARVTVHAEGTSTLVLDVQPQHLNPNGVIHGAALFTLADTGMGAALHSVLPPGHWCATIEIKINYFKPVLRGQVECRCKVVHRGRTVANLDAEVWLDGVLVARANGSFAIFDMKDRRPG